LEHGIWFHYFELGSDVSLGLGAAGSRAVMVSEQLLVLFRAGTSSHRSALGTFLFWSRTVWSIFARYVVYNIDSVDQHRLLCKVYKYLYDVW